MRERRRTTAERDWFLFYFLGRTGLRISEALSLSAGDLHLTTDPPYVQVQTRKQRRPVGDQVLLEESVIRASRTYINRTLPKLIGGGVIPPSHPLFPVADGRRCMTVRNASKLFRLYARRASLTPALSLHSLRHYRGTTLYQTTKDLEFTRSQLRHRSLRSTQVYLHTPPETIRTYMETLDRE